MAYIDAVDTKTMPAGVACEVIACSAGTEVVGPLFSFALGCEGLSSIATTVVVVVCEPLGDGTGANFSSI